MATVKAERRQMKNRRARELQKWQKGKPVRLREGVREAFANECAGVERVPLVDVSTIPPLQTVERHPELLGELAVANAEFLESNGWRELVFNKRGRSAINTDVGSVPHDAAAYLDYLRKFGAPAHSIARPKTPEELQAAADRGRPP